jgi:hypothetical protein
LPSTDPCATTATGSAAMQSNNTQNLNRIMISV